MDEDTDETTMKLHSTKSDMLTPRLQYSGLCEAIELNEASESFSAACGVNANG